MVNIMWIIKIWMREKIIARKMTEELGNDIQYKIGKPIIFMRHERLESSPGNIMVRIFAIGYQATLKKGEVKLTSHHTEMLWVDPEEFNPQDYFTGGWLKGVQEYIQLHKAKSLSIE